MILFPLRFVGYIETNQRILRFIGDIGMITKLHGVVGQSIVRGLKNQSCSFCNEQRLKFIDSDCVLQFVVLSLNVEDYVLLFKLVNLSLFLDGFIFLDDWVREVRGHHCLLLRHLQSFSPVK